MGVVDSVGGCWRRLRRLDGRGREGGTATSWVIWTAIIVLRHRLRLLTTTTLACCAGRQGRTWSRSPGPHHSRALVLPNPLPKSFHCVFIDHETVFKAKSPPTLKHAHFTSVKSLVSTNFLLNRPSALHNHKILDYQSLLRRRPPSQPQHPPRHSIQANDSPHPATSLPTYRPFAYARAQVLRTVPLRALPPLLPACRLRTHALRSYFCKAVRLNQDKLWQDSLAG